jgi:hypothetical protein
VKDEAARDDALQNLQDFARQQGRTSVNRIRMPELARQFNQMAAMTACEAGYPAALDWVREAVRLFVNDRA